VDRTISCEVTTRTAFALALVTRVAGNGLINHGGGDYGPHSGGYHHLGFGTLANTR
jgi:hypothetical protein